MAKILQLFAPTALFKLQTETFPPPLVLGFLEKLLLDEGHQVYSIDANNYGLFKFNKENIAEVILELFIKDFDSIKPDILIISSWTYGMPFVIELIKRIKGKTKIILGGYNSTIFPEKTLKITDADYIFSGNNLFEFVKILRHLPKKRIISSENEMDFDKLPLVDFSSFIFDEKPKKFYLMSSFGCKFKCTFCSDRVLWPGYHSFTPERMIKQIELLRSKFSPTYFAFWESNITMNPSYGKAFLDSYDGKTPWFTYSRLDNLDEERVSMMARKGCRYIFIGLEHFDFEVLKFFNKATVPKDYISRFFKVFSLLKKYSIIPVISLVIGSPVETKKSLSMLLKEVEKMKSFYERAEFELSPITLEIGTELWDYFQKGNTKLYKTDNILLSREYSGIQPFSERYDDVMLAPQKYLMENKTMDRFEFEKEMIGFISKFERITKPEKFK